MKAFDLEKDFYDYADDIAGVNIHYAWIPLGDIPDWEPQRVSRLMPLVRSPSQLLGTAPMIRGSDAASEPEVPRGRQKVLKRPAYTQTSNDGARTDRSLLHRYFELFQDGCRLYSPWFSEASVTGALAQPESAMAATLVLAERGET